MRAVIDVNLLIRAVLSPAGGAGLLWRALLDDKLVSITSRKQLYELHRVLRYSRIVRRYHITRRQRQRLVARLYQRSIWVQTTGRLQLCRDPEDDYLIEMALVGEASHLVTEDKDLLDDADIIAFLSERGIAVVTLVALLQSLR
jgi:putative PIN family toxin of toxin-antitoxin system